MKYISTRGQAPVLDFEEALLAGLASDGGLYMPETWPSFSKEKIASFAHKTYQEIAIEVLSPFLGEEYDKVRFSELVELAYQTFKHDDIAPLRHLPFLEGEQYLLELFHGPTLAFKDIAMQLLARLMDDALLRQSRHATIIGATSGDTGGAAIEAFSSNRAVDIFILYPHGRVSDVQRKQMTTGKNKNVHTIAIEGTFDDCQTLVKSMFCDVPFRNKHSIAGVNSINWARVMAQVVYYFTSVVALGGASKPINFSVPTGNFGDIFAGFVAKRMGLSIDKLMIATNVNDILVRVLETGIYKTNEVVSTSSPSMDIQVSSNFERLLFEVMDRDNTQIVSLMDSLQNTGMFTLNQDIQNRIKQDFMAYRVDEVKTMSMIAQCFEHNVLIDPHTAVGLVSAQMMQQDKNTPVVTLSTAHAAKFPKAVEQAIKDHIVMPQEILGMMNKTEHFEVLPNDLKVIQNYITTQLS